MKTSKASSWMAPVTVAVVVCLCVCAFLVFMSYSKGRLPDAEMLDLSLVHPMQVSSHRSSLKTEDVDNYHFEFFALLDQPTPVRALPRIHLSENPAIQLRERKPMQFATGTSSKYSIHVSSFKKASDAHTMAQRLDVQGYRAVVVYDPSDGSNLYKVRIEAGGRKDQAEVLQSSIAGKTGLKGVIISQ